MKPNTFAFQVIDSPPRRTAVVRAKMKRSALPDFFGHALRHVLEAMEAQGTVPGGEPFAYYRAMHNGMVDVEVGFPIVGRFEASAEVVAGQLPPGKTVTGVHLGPYDTVGRTYADMSAWAIANGLQPTGEMWEVYLTDPERETDPNRWRTGVFVPVK